MAITLDERLISLSEAAALLPGHPALSSLWRWHARGIRGTQLETVVIGGRRYTSREALERFMAATTAAADGQPTPAPDAKQRHQAVARAESVLTAAGIATKSSAKSGDRGTARCRPSNHPKSLLKGE
jgi:hypothetical protein